MNIKELAQILNGRQYGNEITKEEIKQAKENNLIVIFGASDDLMEFEGAISDEFDCYDGGEVYLNEDGIVDTFVDSGCKCCPYYKQVISDAYIIKAIWNEEENEPTWSYHTLIPHETFEIMRDGEIYCRGIVFSMDSLKKEGK